jgi:hypothetical protein
VRLGAEEEQAAAENERRYGVDSVPLCSLRGSIDALCVPPIAESGLGFGPVEAGFCDQIEQNPLVADIDALRPVCAHEPLVHLRMQPLVARQLSHLERFARVRDDVRRSVDEPGCFDRRLRAVVKVRAIALYEASTRDALRRVFRMQIEGKPLDLSAEPALQPVGPLEADEAERSDVVAPNRGRKVAHALPALCSAA